MPFLLVMLAPVPASADWAFAAYLGATRTLPSDLAVSLPAANTSVTLVEVEYAGEPFTSPPYYGYRLAWFRRAHSRIGFEAEVIHLKVLARTDDLVPARGRLDGRDVDASVRMDRVIERFSISHGLNFVLLNIVGRYPIDRHRSDPRVWLTGRAGAGVTVPHAESTIGGRSREQYEIGSVGLQGSVGAEVRVRRRVFGLAEYKLTTTRPSVSVTGGTARARFTTHHALLGVGVRF